MMATETTDHEITYFLRRGEWLQTEFPAVIIWGGLAVVTASPIVILMLWSWWWSLLLFPWFVTTGAKGVGLFWFLLRGAEHIRLRVGNDGIIYLSTNGDRFKYAYWRGFENLGGTFLLWGSDGRYRLIVPKRALREEDLQAIRARTGVDLQALGPGESAFLK